MPGGFSTHLVVSRLGNTAAAVTALHGDHAGKLLQSYWRNVDPLDGAGQFCDRGDSYRPVIFTGDDQQTREALASQSAAAKELGVSESALKVEIKPLEKFWPAEDYHQNFAELNSVKYKYYRWACGRDKRLDEVWGDHARSGDSWTN